MSVKARIFILGVILVGMALSALALPSFTLLNTRWMLMLILVALTTLAQLFVLMGIGNDAWMINLVFLFAGVVLLQPFEFVILVVVPHLIEWAVDVWGKKSARLRNWYIQPFNIAGHLIAGFAARSAYVFLTPAGTQLFASTAFLTAMLAVIVYVGLNHLLVAVALMLARGKTLQQTGMFELGNLFGDLVQTGLGYLWAVLWNLNPLLILPVLAPLIVIYRALTIPRLKQDAQTDAKTGLFNARYSAETLAAEFQKAKRSGQSLSVIMSDLDLLRNINNTYGHLAGDTVLIGVARVVRETVGDTGIAGRFGGEEFLVILPRLTEAEAQAVAERVRRAVELVEFRVAGHPQPIHVTMSLGVAEYSTDILSAKDLVHEADVAVYQAKLQGRNRVVCSSDVPRSVKLESQASDARLESPYTAAFTPGPIVMEDDDAVTNVQSQTQPSPQTAPTPAPAGSVVPLRGKAARWLMPFVGSVIVAGLITAALGLRLDFPTNYGAIVLFALLAGLAEFFQMDLYGDGSISVSVAISFAAALVAGIPGVIVTSACITLVHALRRRGVFYKTAFNWSNHILAALAPVLLIRAQGITLQVSNLLLLAALAVVAALVYFGIETGLIATAIGLSENRNPYRVWRNQYRWLLLYYLLLGLMGSFLSLAYVTLGVPGVVVFTFPILMMRFAQKEYIDRTQESVREFKRMNQQLTLANDEIAGASRAIRQLNDELFLTLSKIIDARDPYVAGHASKVADYAVAMGADLGLGVNRLEPLRQAGLLHDIGKLGVSEQVLQKPARLTDDEYTYVKTHTVLGAEFLETCQGLRHLAPLIRHHHEWWDGNGYPDRLKGEQISLEARILAVCDAVEAMASDRPYHHGMPLDEIIVELQRCAGTQFDPAVVEAFIRVAARLGDQFVVNSGQEVAQRRLAPHVAQTTGNEQFASEPAVNASAT